MRAYIPEWISDGSAGEEAGRSFLAVDATCGNGHDTLALAQMLWPDGDAAASGALLYAFDIQKDAAASTRRRLIAGGYRPHLEDGRIRILCESHENIPQHLDGRAIDLIVFNLGYLPGGDRTVTTEAASTLCAVISSINDLSAGGLVCITMYSGHPSGAKEKAELLRFAEALDPSVYHVSYLDMLNQPNDPPEILLITRKK